MVSIYTVFMNDSLEGQREVDVASVLRGQKAAVVNGLGQLRSNTPALTLARSLDYPLPIDPRIAGQVGARQCTHRITPTRQSQMQS